MKRLLLFMLFIVCHMAAVDNLTTGILFAGFGSIPHYRFMQGLIWVSLPIFMGMCFVLELPQRFWEKVLKKSVSQSWTDKIEPIQDRIEQVWKGTVEGAERLNTLIDEWAALGRRYERPIDIF